MINLRVSTTVYSRLAPGDDALVSQLVTSFPPFPPSSPWEPKYEQTD